MKPTKCSAKETKNEARKVKVKTAVSDLLEILLSVHARTSQANNIICIWIRRPRSVRPVNGFVLSFSSL